MSLLPFGWWVSHSIVTSEQLIHPLLAELCSFETAVGMTVNQLDANSQKLHGVLESLGPCSSVSAALGQGLGFLYPRVHVVSLNHRLTYWRAGASKPSRSTGTIFHYIYIFLVCRVVFHAFTILRTTRCTVNRSNFTYSVSRACANIYTYRFDLLRIRALTGHLYYSWQVCV